MNRNNVILPIILCGIIVFLLLRPTEVKVPNLGTAIDSLRNAIAARDTVIIPHDTVIYRTTKTREIITQYRTEYDTITRLQLCDSMTVLCDSLAIQFRRQDSVYVEQVGDLKEIVAKQDTVIQEQGRSIRKLKRQRFALLGGISILAGLTITK